MTRAEKNLAGLTRIFQGINVHEGYLRELEKEDFCSGLDALAQTFNAIYIGMIREIACPSTKSGESNETREVFLYF